MDECLLGESKCHENATCTDVVGGEDSYNCTCNTGFTGDGSSCVGEELNKLTSKPKYYKKCLVCFL